MRLPTAREIRKVTDVATDLAALTFFATGTIVMAGAIALAAYTFLLAISGGTP